MDFDFTDFSLKKLVILDLSMSRITEDWDGWNHIKVAVDLKVLNLTGCQELRKTPDLSFHVNLERLILERCENLVQIDPSIFQLQKLAFLNLKHCCSLQKLPDQMGELKCLSEHLLDSTSVEEIPEWGTVKRLEILSLVESKSLNKFNFVGCAASSAELSSVDILLTRLPKSIENFISLTELDLSDSAIQELPDSIGNMKNLKVLKMHNSSIRKLPSAIGMLEKLELLEIGGLSKFGGEIPDNIGKLPFSKKLSMHPCIISGAPQQLPESLIELHFTSFSIEKLPDLSNLLNLTTSYLNCPSITTFLPDIIFLSQLKELRLCCWNLRCLPRLPTNLSYLWIGSKKRLETTNDLSDLKSLSGLTVRNCDKLVEIQGLEGLENLILLELDGLPSLAKLPDLSNFKKLKIIDLKDCPELFEIRDGPESLELLDMKGCLNLDKLLDLSRSENPELRLRLRQKELAIIYEPPSPL